MSNAKRLIVGLVVLVGGFLLGGCATVQAPPELVKAIEAGDVGMVKTIVGVNPKLVNSKQNDRYANTPLTRAVIFGHKEIIELLIAKGANVETKANGGTPLNCAMCTSYAYRGEEIEMVPNAKEVAMILIENGANVKKTGWRGQTLLHCAAKRGLYNLAELLIERGVNVNARYKGGQPSNPDAGFTALHYAAKRGHKEIVELLITNGADVNVKDKQNKTPLQWAIEYKNPEIISLLKKHGAVE